MVDFLRTSSPGSVRAALLPYCRRYCLPVPANVEDGVRLAVGLTNSKGQTPLMYACAAGCPELVRFLLSLGADPWVVDRCTGRTALHYAASSGCAGCVAALLELPPSMLTRHGHRYVNARNLSGLAPLHFAVFYERHDALRALLRHDPDIGAATTCDSYDAWADGEARATPLHFAAARSNYTAALEILRFYVRAAAGAARRRTHALSDPRKARNACGRRPWQLAAGHYPADRSLAVLLHPEQPLSAALGDDVSFKSSRMGPPSLAALAAAALKDRLLQSLEAVQARLAPPDAADANPP
ncbi:hypothetical protein GPECTOR_6g539 [Gonium pectorale]|uniref:Uncharacterized protein n=1 Tax=Gonium pectorale TaxID=33097 RepID=A0A150GV93_GONPE|nr:hypothetical protein GPECTOR_6g539 [Gonium pectorale]|eukprot:KXZ53622.1 hypothetical protein GPECTOR_6g539 [Gonium pectorale]